MRARLILCRMNASRYIFACVTLTAALAVACSDDTTGTSDATTSGQGGSTTTTSGQGGMSTTSGGGMGQGGMAEGGNGAGGSGLATEALAFCKKFEQTCGFSSGTFDTAMDCIGDYTDKFTPARRECVQTHLDLAANDATTHCPHASGDAPCD